MAYLNLLASVPENCVIEFQKNKSILQASKIIHVSHFVAYSITVQLLGKTLGEAIDVGEVLGKNISHPFRVPIWHKTDSVKAIFAKLQSDWQKVIDVYGEISEDDWYKIEIEKVLSIFQHASKKNEAIISFLDLNNFDIENN